MRELNQYLAIILLANFIGFAFTSVIFYKLMLRYENYVNNKYSYLLTVKARQLCHPSYPKVNITVNEKTQTLIVECSTE